MITTDKINHPPHYTAHPSGVECIQITEHFSFNVGNAIKYLWRADEKAAPLDDLKKAGWYIEREITRRINAANTAPLVTKSDSSPNPMSAKSVSSTSPIPQTNPATFVSESDARVAFFTQQMSALSKAVEIWLRDSGIKEEAK
jgi:hypothetical protein